MVQRVWRYLLRTPCRFKALKPELRGERYIKHLRKEYDIAAMLSHRGIVTVLDFTDVPGLGQSIVMEYIDGMTLSDYLSANAPLAYTDAAGIISRICDAVAYMHSRQIIHRDLKPSNIMIIPDGGYIRIIDFGVCQANGFERLDISGGTKGFSAPEAFATARITGPQADIYSIGKLMRLLIHEPAPHIVRLIERCTAENPDNRPTHADNIPKLLLSHRPKKKSIIATSIIGTAIVTGIAGLLIWDNVNNQSDNLQSSEIPPTYIKNDSTISGNVSDDIASPAKIHEDNSETASNNAGNPTNSIGIIEPADTNLLFDEQLYRETLRCAEKRFADHINMIDTMTSLRSAELAIIKHWRWLAKQDVRHWLEKRLSPDNPRIESLMADVAKAITAYGDEPDNAGTEYEHYIRASQREGAKVGASTQSTYMTEDDRVCVETLHEDGTWAKKIYSLRSYREKMKKEREAGFHPGVDENGNIIPI